MSGDGDRQDSRALLTGKAALLLYPGSHETRNGWMWATGPDLPGSKSD